MRVRHMHAVPGTYIHIYMYMNLEQHPAAAAAAVIQVDSTHTADTAASSVGIYEKRKRLFLSPPPYRSVGAHTLRHDTSASTSPPAQREVQTLVPSSLG
jgi:hypothetical protein